MQKLPESMIQRIFSFCPSKVIMLSEVCRTYGDFVVPAVNECMCDANQSRRADDEIDDLFQLITSLVCIERYKKQTYQPNIIQAACDLWVRLGFRLGRRTWISATSICCLAMGNTSNVEQIFKLIGKENVLSIGTFYFKLALTIW
jgi:hypothetical protein